MLLDKVVKKIVAEISTKMSRSQIFVSSFEDTRIEGDYLFDLNRASFGCYEEASALFACRRVRELDSYSRKVNNDSVTGLRRSRGRPNPQNMGSNVSRHSGKGLSGRRSQSSGNLCKILVPRVGKVFNPCGEGGIKFKNRKKMCGSLPNHLDNKDVSGSSTSQEALYRSSTYEEIFSRSRSKNVDILYQTLVPKQDGGNSQRYNSVWSAEDDLTPLISNAEGGKGRRAVVWRSSEVTFITKDNTFEVRLEKGSRGLGLSVSGGIDGNEEYPGLIRIKRIFPHQPAWECGALKLGDIILAVNGTPLTGFTNHEALEVLRMASSDVVLKISRPPTEVFHFFLPEAEERPVPPKREHAPLSSQNSNTSHTLPMSPVSGEPYGEFYVTIKKIGGSLGFTLRREDESVLGHYVRALVREPAISDGRIRPGDKIVSVNGIDISTMSHKEAVTFLRESGDEVTLRLYRDPSQTPVSALSPTESHKVSRPKPRLRKEAMDMLSDLAVKKLSPNNSRSSRSRSRLRGSSPGGTLVGKKSTKAAIEGESATEDYESEVSDSEEKSGGSRNISMDHFKEDAPTEPASMPPVPTFASESRLSNPAYQSANSAIRSTVDPGRKKPSNQSDQKAIESLLKWKGIIFEREERWREDALFNSPTNQVLTVELSRGWSSRLGFSLQNSDYGTLISTVYPDSVAARDGRLRPGDRILMINNELTRYKGTSLVIDELRRARGPISITILREIDPENH